MEKREDFERLLLRLADEVVGRSADYVLDPDPHGKRPHEARVRFSSRAVPERSVGVRLDEDWLEACFFIEPNVSILDLDDFGADDVYTTEHVLELLAPVESFLQGEGSFETRRNLLGTRRPQIRFNVNGREWLAR